VIAEGFEHMDEQKPASQASRSHGTPNPRRRRPVGARPRATRRKQIGTALLALSIRLVPRDPGRSGHARSGTRCTFDPLV